MEPFAFLLMEFLEEVIEEVLLLRVAFVLNLLLMVSVLTNDEFRLGETRGVDLLPMSLPMRKLSDLPLTTTTTFLSFFFFSEELGDGVLEKTELAEGLRAPLEQPESHRLDLEVISVGDGMVVAKRNSSSEQSEPSSMAMVDGGSWMGGGSSTPYLDARRATSSRQRITVRG